MSRIRPAACKTQVGVEGFCSKVDGRAPHTPHVNFTPARKQGLFAGLLCQLINSQHTTRLIQR